MTKSKTEAAMKLLELLACLVFVNHVGLALSSSHGKRTDTTPDPDILANYSTKVSETLTLDAPKILSQNDMTVDDLISKVYKNPDHQLVLTVVINNYSRFKLTHLYTSENKNCAYNNEV